MAQNRTEMIIPCRDEGECVELVFDEISRVFSESLPDHPWSVLYVDDGSTDDTLPKIKALAEKHGEDKVRYISLARNFGKEAAVFAGLSNARGDYVCLMDADLQHPPALIPEMIQAVESGEYDCAAARRVSRRGEPFIRSALSKGFYGIINFATGIGLVPGMTDFRLMRREVAEAVTSLQERERFLKGIYSWVGFNTKWIEYENVERAAGSTKWSMGGLWSYAKSGYIAFATAPLRGVIYMGMVIVLISLIYGIYVYIQAKTGARVWTDTLTIILLLLFIGGTIITILGVIGEYLARVYMEVKNRPIYIAKEKNFGENS